MQFAGAMKNEISADCDDVAVMPKAINANSQFSRLCRKLESIAWRDVGGRSSQALRVPGDLERAAVAFANARGVLILTGFPCHVDADVKSETDGLSGAIALAAAARVLNKPCAIATDECCAAGLRLALETRSRARGALVEAFVGGVAPDSARAASLLALYDHTVACERAGVAADGTYRTMRAIDMGSLVARLDVLLSSGTAADVLLSSGTAAGGVAHERVMRSSTGIGDGGNECGMGAVRKAVMATVPNGAIIACVTVADATIVTGVSNWGGWALAAAIGVAARHSPNRGDTRAHCQPTLLPTEEEEDALDLALEAAGVGDGVSGQVTPSGSVDGMQAPVHRSILAELKVAVDEWEVEQREVDAKNSIKV